MKISKLKERTYIEYVKNGFVDFFELHKVLGDLAECGLINTEVSEALESIRKNDYVELAEELADIIIRTLNFATRKHINIELALKEKIKKNEQREYKHGNTNI